MTDRLDTGSVKLLPLLAACVVGILLGWGWVRFSANKRVQALQIRLTKVDLRIAARDRRISALKMQRESLTRKVLIASNEASGLRTRIGKLETAIELSLSDSRSPARPAGSALYEVEDLLLSLGKAQRKETTNSARLHQANLALVSVRATLADTVSAFSRLKAIVRRGYVTTTTDPTLTRNKP